MSATALHIEFIGAGGWTVTGAQVHEALNEPYVARITLSNTTLGSSADELIGTDCELLVNREGREQKVLGICTGSRQTDERHQQVNARIVVEPALAALRMKKNTKIFQEITVPDILKEVLGTGLGFFKRSARQDLSATYPKREYTVQYQETDFDFVHRLMEEEGIIYWFDHEGAVEEMVLIDDMAKHPDYDGAQGTLLDYVEYDVSGGGASVPEAVHRFEWVARLSGNKVSTRHYDWTHPTLPHADVQAGGDGPVLEAYLHDTPVTLHEFSTRYGAHNTTDQTRLIKELQGRDAKTADGSASALNVRPGRKFELNGHLRVDLNSPYVVTRVEHSYLGVANMPEMKGLAYSNRFFCLPAETQWRPARTRNRQRIHGIQTATVVGPAGEEIHTDEHGRIKVQFHWDRLGQNDDKSSCWIRVMQALGGGDGWGFSFIPRIGMEVMITFVNGDPDRPMVTGAVYNPVNRPPYDYPREKTKTTIKTNSSLGGDGFNELRFEDKAGEEEIFLHGQKDWNTIILNNHDRKVHNCESEFVAIDRTRVVGVNERITIGLNKTTMIGENCQRTVGVNDIVNIGNDRMVTIVGKYKFKCGKAMITIEGDHVEITTPASLKIIADDTIDIEGKKGVNIKSCSGSIKLNGGPKVELNC